MIWRRLISKTQDYLRRVQDPTPQSSRLLYKFSTEADLAAWSVFTDQRFGGKSTAGLALSEERPGTAAFSGVHSTELSEGADSAVKRSGFCSISHTMPGEEVMDLGEFDSLSFRVFGDGRKYIANIRTDNWVVGDQSMDVWQAFLFARKGAWQEVHIPLDRFLLTWKGKLVESRVEMNTERVVSVGISVAGGGSLQEEGPFSLGLDWIKAKNLALDSDDEE